MTPDDFLSFRQVMGVKLNGAPKLLSERRTAEILGATRHQVRAWSNRDPPPLYIGYACQAIVHNFQPWSLENAQ